MKNLKLKCPLMSHDAKLDTLQTHMSRMVLYVLKMWKEFCHMQKYCTALLGYIHQI